MENGNNVKADKAAKKTYTVKAKEYNWGTKDKKGTPKRVLKRGDKVDLTDHEAKVLRSKFVI